MRVPLQEWYDGWLREHRDTSLIYASPSGPNLEQVHFVRDTLSELVWCDVPYDSRPRCPSPRDALRETAWVVGEHHSKSVRLPVYSLERPDLGLRLVLRYNFHDWNISVISERSIEMSLEGFSAKMSPEDREKWRPGGYWGYLFFQGFPDDVCFKDWTSDPRRFSLAPNTDYECHAFVRGLMQAVKK